MSLPPEQVVLKRKRSAAQPPEALYFEHSHGQGKRRMVSVAQNVYVLARPQRQTATAPVAAPAPPKLITTRPGEEVGYFERLKARAARDEQEQTRPLSDQLQDSTQAQTPDEQPGPRRFHLSRLAPPPSTISAVGPRKRKAEQVVQVAVFVEAAEGDRAAKASRANDDSRTTTKLASQVESRQPESASSTSPTRFKKPGATAAMPKIPASRQPSDLDDQQRALHAALQNFAQEELERESNSHAMIKEDPMDVSEDDDYVYETYVRQSPGKASSTMDTMSSNSYGLLVVPEEDEEFFWDQFADSWSDSDDWDSDQDDENAENWYGADYPEDEVASDDEYDLDAYQYRHQGASDEEEFGFDDEDWNGSDNGDNGG